MAYCFNCGTRLNEDDIYCPECGIDQRDAIKTAGFNINPDEAKICNHCGCRMPIDALYCLGCGNSFSDMHDDFEDAARRIRWRSGVWRKRRTALLLCIFFGWLGVHKYYESKIGMGILYTLTVGLFGLGWIVDIFLISRRPNEYQIR